MTRFRLSVILALPALLLPACAPTLADPAAPAAPAEATAAAVVPERPLPAEVVPPPAFLRAVQQGTRTLRGAPGPRYWQNWAEYDLHARLLPDLQRLEATGTVRYHNRSPDTLEVLVMDIAQNFHAPGAVRLEPAEVTGGVTLARIAVSGVPLRPAAPGVTGPRYVVDGTKLVLVPPTPVLPGQTAELELEWSFTIPQAGAGARMGYSEDDLFYLAYWYPQMAVYDDVGGWHPDQFLGVSEFYAGFGDYEVTVEAPAGWLIRGTGELTNAEQVLDPQVLGRFRAAAGADTVSRVFDPDRHPSATRGGAVLRWEFQADSVRDLAFSATSGAIWDVTRTPVGDRDGDGAVEYARIEAVYRQPAFRWQRVAEYQAHAIDFLSRYTGYPYPYPHMTAVEGAGIIGGGMEFPMMTLIGDYTAAGDSALYYVTAHELAHMWIPMVVGTDERRYSWFDEGFTSFAENQARGEFFPGVDHDEPDRQDYIRIALAGQEGEMMTSSAYHVPGPAFVVASYRKPATVLVALRAVLGEEVFNRAYQEFIRRWAFKHPQPWDLWNTFENVSGRELDWFWHSWYFETWTLDQAVAAVERTDAGTRIVIEDQGNVPMPARLRITRQGGEVLEREVPVERWLAGARTAEVVLPPGPPVVRVEIDPAGEFPDMDRADNVWVP